MITKEQVRAARAYLGWDREKLSEESGISLPQIANFETGKTESPRQRTLMEIESALLRAGIIFKDGGVLPRTDCTTRIEGPGWYLRLLAEVEQTISSSASKDVVVLYGDESRSPPEVVALWDKIRASGAAIRRVVRAGDTFLRGPLDEYRYMPAKFFNNYVIIVYADKVAICAANNTMALVIEDAPLAQSFKLQADFFFSVLETPIESKAHDRV